ncbi:BlaI/MecI/CopY family transcriptional regulator [Staphylococcus arlettae]|uniref:Beta-lactamase repressor n=1 Tax=Staphylococcus arlettae TaxID=29378 RepID=A0A1W5QE99_9STAP|nr:MULTISPECIES: BlaI/MecI/CopY family transcriptional regulator [Staphylococcus]HAP2020689.1 BlaI/MecI/CopY family transcriptional regulator [Escherichia coli]APY23793.1 beta-lactamase repressor [Staphylococcus arlettae]APY23842.1 beta-lactamase repressor [Staphylococcus arlettae]APY23845.1 beta-lactamase repressor [Staphylococcus arlettae]APY23848.1 beta-lactamase repressor [Staphylococcus arlettae]
MTEKAPDISNAEWEIINVLWTQSPLSANHIIEQVQQSKAWNEKTIRTLITRLYKKGLLSREKQDGVYQYTPTVEEDYMKYEKTKTLVNQLYGGDVKSLVLNFVEQKELNEQDLQELHDLLEDLDK